MKALIGYVARKAGVTDALVALIFSIVLDIRLNDYLHPQGHPPSGPSYNHDLPGQIDWVDETLREAGLDAIV